MLIQQQVFLLNKQNILNYERKLIESPFQSLPKPTSRNDSKYSVCQLYDKIQQLVEDSPHNLRWIGNRPSSYIQAYIYCLLMLSIQNSKNLLMFKNVFYEISRKYLDVKKQKLIIQFLCLLQFTSDKYVFLKKYPMIQEIILQLFGKVQEENLYGFQTQRNQMQQQQLKHSQYKDIPISQPSSKDQQNYYYNENQDFKGINKLVQIYSKFSKRFNFLKWSKSSQSSFIFSIQDNKKMHIIIQKQYFFALQILNQSQVKSSKNRLTKGDRIQVEKLLNASRVESQASLHEKLNFLNQTQQKHIIEYANSQSLQKGKSSNKQSSKDKREPFWNHNHMVNSDDPKYLKKDAKFLPPFPKKMVQSIQQVSKSRKQNPQKKLQYIDLMESSFEQEIHIQQSRQHLIDKNDSQNHKFCKVPRYIPKSINNQYLQSSNTNQFTKNHNVTLSSSFNSTPVNNNSSFAGNFSSANTILSTPNTYQTSGNLVMDFKKKLNQSPEQKLSNAQVFNRSRKVSNAQSNGLTSVFVPLQKQKKRIKSKQIRFYSPPLLSKQSPDQKFIQKDKNKSTNKKLNDISIKDKREQFKQLDKKYFQKKQEIAQKIKAGQKPGLNNKFPTTLFSSLKGGFNNRISLQSRQDLQRLPRYNTQQNGAMLQQINELLKRSQNVNKKVQISINQNRNIQNFVSQSNDMDIQNRKQKLSQSLNTKQQLYLKKRIFQHVASKFGEQNLLFKKMERNKSMQQIDEDEKQIESNDQMRIYQKKDNINRSRNNFTNLNSVSIQGQNRMGVRNNNYRKVQDGNKQNDKQQEENGGFQIKVTYAK